MTVYGVFEFVAYFAETLHDHLLFAFRQMQRFVRLVRKERILPHVPAERSAADNVGMEQQCIAFGLEHLSVVLHAEHLPGRHAYKRSFLIVVILPAVNQIAALHLFEKNGVESERMLEMSYRIGL